MKNKTVVLVQANSEESNELAAYLTAESDFEVVGCAAGGVEGMKLIEEFRPDFALLELCIEGYDGLYLLDKIKDNDIQTQVIVASSYVNDKLIASAVNKGAAFFMVKPFENEALAAHMRKLFEPTYQEQRKFTSNNIRLLEERISNIFLSVGIPPHIKGYPYLREGVMLAVINPDIINNITKQLYPMIGDKFGTTPSKVERAIRHAIEVACNRGKIENINSILGIRAYISSEKPTNGEFIALIADKLLHDGMKNDNDKK